MVSEQDLAKLRDRVIRLEGQLAYVYKHLGISFVAESAPGDDPRIIEEIKKGNLLGAIKVFRELNGGGYEDGKLAVEEIKGRLGL